MKFNFMKIIVAVILLVNSLSLESNAEELSLFASNAIVMEANTGEVLYEKNMKEKMYPASTTKLWTAHLVIENIKDLNKKITVEGDLSWVEPSSMYLKEGETFTVRELLEVLMLKSANDVAVLLAIETSGSVEEFAKLMNEEAKKIGCMGTNFVNPNGLPDDNHYSTAYDMALISREAIKNKSLMEIVNTKEIVLPANEYYPYERRYINSNKFLTGEGQMSYKGEMVDYKYDIVDGLKTGYTSKAGRCLMSTAKIGDMRVIVGVFNSKGDDVYTDSRMLIDYAFDNYETESVVKSDEIQEELKKSLWFSSDSKVSGYIKEDFLVLKEKSLKNRRSMSNDEYRYEVDMVKGIKTSVNEGDVIGNVKVYKNDEVVDTLDVYASATVKPIFDLEQIILLSFGTSLLIFILIRKIKRKKEEENNSSVTRYVGRYRSRYRRN